MVFERAGIRMLRLMIPIESFDIERSVISEHFEQAPEFVVIDLSREGRVISITSKRNVGEHFGGRSGLKAIVTSLRPDALVVKGMELGGLAAFQDSGIAVFASPVNSVGEAVEAYLAGRLSCLTERRKDPRHTLLHG
jgi:predicted Fe-Mo cluster-binding NifX family protein